MSLFLVYDAIWFYHCGFPTIHHRLFNEHIKSHAILLNVFQYEFFSKRKYEKQTLNGMELEKLKEQKKNVRMTTFYSGNAVVVMCRNKSS